MARNSIDIERLKRDLMDYYGTAAHSGFDMAIIDVVDVENASPDKLIDMAIRAGFDIEDYQEEDLER